MKLHLKYASVVALPMALVFSTLSMQGQTTQNADTSSQSAQSAPAAVPAQQTHSANTSAQSESLADRARKVKRTSSQSQSAGKPKNFNQDNLAAATSGKTHSSKGRKPKRNGLHKTS